MPRIIADVGIPYLKGLLEPYAEVIYLPADEMNRHVVKDADALIIRTRTVCDASLLEGTVVRFIASATSGDDHIDRDYCLTHGIAVHTSVGCNADAVAEYVATALVVLSFRKHFELKGAVLGVIGAGRIGSRVARLASTLGMKVLLNDPPREEKDGFASVPLPDLLEESDVLSFHVPLTSSGKHPTRQMAGMQFFSGIKRPVHFINTSRGEVVSGSALKEAIGKGTVRSAILDVFENEPRVNAALLQQLFLATPHIAGYSIRGKINATRSALLNISEYFGFGLTTESLDMQMPYPAPVLFDYTGGNEVDMLYDLMTTSCDIENDDRRLRHSPVGFEMQRIHYRHRLQFCDFVLRGLQGIENKDQLPVKLGFLFL